MATVNLTGQRFGRLVVLRKSEHKTKYQKWHCLCDCGNEALTVGSDIRSGHTRSCGCLTKETIGRLNRTHGQSRTPEYFIWAGMMTRCYNPRHKTYSRYGGRGIIVCQRWRDSFEEFLVDMGLRPTPKHSIDRINNDGNYEPTNCRWATQKQQCRNNRNNRLVEFHGEIKPLIAWAEQIGIGINTLWKRLNDGWTIEEALTTPLRPY